MSTTAPEAPQTSTITSILQGAADFAALLETAGSVGKNLIKMLAPAQLAAQFEVKRVDLGAPTSVGLSAEELAKYVERMSLTNLGISPAREVPSVLGRPTAALDPRDETPLALGTAPPTGTPEAAIAAFKAAVTEPVATTAAPPKKSPAKRAPAKKAPAKVGTTGNTRGVTVNGRKADGSLDLRTKEGRALKEQEDAAAKATSPAKAAPAKKAPAAKAPAKAAPVKKAPAKATKAPAAKAPVKAAEKPEDKPVVTTKVVEPAKTETRARRPLAAVPTAPTESDKAVSAV